VALGGHCKHFATSLGALHLLDMVRRAHAHPLSRLLLRGSARVCFLSPLNIANMVALLPHSFPRYAVRIAGMWRLVA